MEETTCEICGARFSYYPSDKKGLYCPECVKTKDWHHKPDISGERNPRWKGGKRTVDCVVCGTTVERYPSELEADGIVCRESCRREWLSEAFTGEGHPNWKGGPIEGYGKGWASVRRQALERDDFSCAVCSTSKEAIGRNPDVHHIVPVRTFDRPEEAHTLGNVITLCTPCHRKADFGAIARDALRSLIDTRSEGSRDPE